MPHKEEVVYERWENGERVTDADTSIAARTRRMYYKALIKKYEYEIARLKDKINASKK